MAKISDLSDGGSLLPTDDLVAVRSGANVKVKADNITVDRIDLGDNEKIRLGDSQDLQIYHNGTDNYVDAAGVGHLYLQSQGDDKDVKIRSDDGSGGLTEYFRADGSLGQAQLYYYGSKKLHTVTGGIDVTGTVTADGLTVGATSAPTISIEDSDGGFTASSFSATNGGRDLTIKAPQEVVIQDADTGNNWLRIDEGDISFYEDTGTTAKLFWDASAESLGIGTTTPASNTVHIASATNTTALKIQNSATSGRTYQLMAHGGGSSLAGKFSVYDETAGIHRIALDSSGNVGIGTTTPAQPIEILKTSAGAVVPMLQLRNGDATAGSGTTIKFMHSTVSNATAGTSEITAIRTSGNYGALTFRTSGNTAVVDEVMRITDSGVGIGTTSPAQELHVAAGFDPTIRLEITDGSLGMNQVLGDIEFYQNDPSSPGVGVVGLIRCVNSSSLNGEGELTFHTGTSSSIAERMRIDSSGNVGIGTASPDAALDVLGSSGDQLRLRTAETEEYKIGRNSSTGFLDLYGTQTGYTGYTFGGVDGERMRIDSSGNLLVGTTTTTAGNEGMVYFNGSSLRVTRDSDEPLNLDRLTTDGSIIDFKKDGATVGSITANSGSGGFLGIKAGGSNELLLPLNSTPPRIQPSVDDSFDIGTASAQFKNFYLSGEIYNPAAYNQTTGLSANMYVNSAGRFFRSTSSERYKNTIQDATHGLTELLTLRPVTYKGNDDGDVVFGGLIAEEVHDAGLTEFVQYNEENQPDALAYGNMVSLCIKAIQEQQDLIESLTARIAALEGAN